MGRLPTFEFLAVLAFVALSVATVSTPPSTLRPIDIAALTAGTAEESWTGIFIGEAHAGVVASDKAVFTVVPLSVDVATFDRVLRAGFVAHVVGGGERSAFVLVVKK